MERTFDVMGLAGEALMREALDALRAYHGAQAAGAPSEQIEQLRILAESLFQAVTDYHLYALGHQSLSRQ